MPRCVDPVKFVELRKELSQLPKRISRKDENGNKILNERDLLFVKYGSCGLTQSNYYRWEREKFGRRRSDAGKLRVSEEQIERALRVHAIKMRMTDFVTGRGISTGQAIHLAEIKGVENGGIERGSLKERNANKLIEKLHLSKPRAVVRFQAKRPLQVFQCDVSGSAYLKVINDMGDGEYRLMRRAPNELLSKKQKQEGLRLWIVGAVDDFSGYCVMKYYVSRGESAEMVRTFLHSLFRGEIHGKILLKGLPEALYMDNGPFAKSSDTATYLSERTGVGVELKLHEPYRSQSGGKMERWWRSLKGGFETGFLSGNAEWRLSEVNRMVGEWCCEMASRKHRNLPMTREQALLSHLPQRVLIPPADAMKYAYRTFERTVGLDCLISVDSVKYAVPVELRGTKVLVHRNAFGQVTVEHVETGYTERVEVWSGPRDYGDFESYPETAVEKTQKLREAGDWGDIEHPLAARDDGEGMRDETRPTTRPYEEDSGQAGTHASANKVIPFIPEERQAVKQTPFTEGEFFGDGFAAKIFIAEQLGIPLIKLRKSDPEFLNEIEALVQRTLKREEIVAWAERAKRRDAKAEGGVA